MALVSRSIFRNWWDDIDRYHREVEENFRKLSLRDDDLWRNWRLPSVHDRFRPWRDVFYSLESEIGGWATVERDGNKYRIVVDVQQYAPEEITVRTDDRSVTVEAKHHERKDKYGYVSRQFSRRYLLPVDYKIGYEKPSLSSDGILTITATRSWTSPLGYDRSVPIRRTYLPAIKS